MSVQYVNPACAKALNYSSPGELVGRHVDEALTSDKNPIDIYDKIRQHLQTGQVRFLHMHIPDVDKIANHYKTLL